MKPRKNIILIMLLGLLLVAFAASIAQTPSGQGEQKKSEACCSMESCCCNGSSCPLKEDGTANSEAKDSCCSNGCCSGDSCDMKKHDAKHHDAKGSCCKMKHKEKNKQKA
jgi:hypothetical protein